MVPLSLSIISTPNQLAYINWSTFLKSRSISPLLSADPFRIHTADALRNTFTSELSQQTLVLGMLTFNEECRAWFYYQRRLNSQMRILQMFSGQASLTLPEKKALAEAIPLVMKQDSCSECVWRVCGPQMEEWQQEIGGTPSNRGLIMELPVSKLNVDFLQYNLQKGQRIEQDYELQEYKFPPEHLHPEYARAATQLLSDMPILSDSIRPELSVEELRARIQSLTLSKADSVALILFHRRSNELIGVNWGMIPTDSHEAFPGFIGVHSDHRKGGLAGYMRAHMINRIIRSHPEVQVLRSEVFAENAPVIRFNTSWGFEVAAREQDFKIPDTHFVSYAEGNQQLQARAC